MLEAAPHRGTVFELAPRRNVVLGVATSNGTADAALSSGELSVAFTGQLDNARELRRELVDQGYTPASPSPADIVASAFQAYGTDAPGRMRGAFSACVTDGQQVWLFRDHVGFKPLFFAERSNCVFVATEVKQVLAGAEIPREPDMDVLERIFWGRLKRDSPAAFKGVERVPQASTLSINGTGARTVHRYWDPRRALETATISAFDDVQDRFDDVFGRAVSRCLTGTDVVSLSGGIDSPAVAGFAASHARSVNGSLAALSLVFPDHPAVDERPYIEAVTDFLKIPLHTLVGKARNHDDAPMWVALFDGPIPTVSGPQLTEFYQTARDLGFRNILTGELAEYVVDMQQHVIGHLFIHGRWRSLARLWGTRRRQGKLKTPTAWKDFAVQAMLPLIPGRFANWYYSMRDRGVQQRLPLWLDYNKANEVPFRSDLLVPGRARWSESQVRVFSGCPIPLEAVDTCASAAGVTVRRPFADVDLWEFFLSLRAEVKFPDLRSKTLLRRLLRTRVPDTILDRRDKTYFDDSIMAQVNYDTLNRFLLKPKYRLGGVDYEQLAERLERRNLTLIDVIWATDLLGVHAFLSQW
jgi:asparagine synthase (glutamine-hydrolysing)